MYGLELVEASNGALKRGTVYVTLARMENAGLLRSITGELPAPGGLPRRRYQISAEGVRALRACELAGAELARPVAR